MLSTSIRVIIKSFAILICMIMSSIKSYRALILCSILHLWSLTIIKAQDGPFYRCPSDPTFTPNSTYQTNRNALLSSLSSNSTRGNGFYSLTIGNNTPDITSGLFLCRGDVNNESCGACVRGAAVVLTQSCPDQRSAIIHFDDCVLSYWNEGYDSSTVRSEPFLRLRNAQYISEPGRFRQLLLNTMTNLTSRAAASKLPGKKFATQEVEFSTYQTIYCLAQCTPDLSEMHCRECLNGAVARIQHGPQGGRIIFPSCTVRFNLYPFYTWTVNPSSDAGSSPIPSPIREENNRVSTATIVAIVVPVAVVLILVVVGLCFFVRKKARKAYNAAAEEAASEISIDELLRFGLASIEALTNNFSADNKLGEGGFGDVYKGMLPDGQEIAVKRLLNANFLQGAQEFKNEVALVAKLQHRNLVRLLGYCLEANEKILVYEFVPNKSLDYFLFGSERKGHLDWSTRYKIIDGVARGMVYLHEDSRLRIIHRDLKAANVLLDKDMTPKIADFGTARIIGVDQTDDNTKRVVGTFGYMAPEYVMHGNYSLKSDVYSFGVLVLEIISGKKNKYQSTNAENLLQYAWKLWNNNTPFEVLDPCLGEDYSRSEVMRCFRIALLCVQEDPADRPSMMAVVLMLGGQSTTVPDPNQPASVFDSGAELMMLDTEQASKAVAWSVNEASISELLPR